MENKNELQEDHNKARIAAERVKMYWNFDDKIRFRDFKKLTPEIFEQKCKKYNLENLDVKKLQLALKQSSYFRSFSGDITLLVCTSFDLEKGIKGEFTSRGSGRVIVLYKMKEILYSTQFYRTVLMEDFLKRLLYEALFISCQHEYNRPLDKNGKLMRIKQDIKGVRWVSSSDENEDSCFYNGKIPPELHSYALKIKNNADYWKNVLRSRRKVQNWKKDSLRVQY